MSEKRTYTCPVHGCGETKHRRYLFCSKCWSKLPLNLRVSVRDVPKNDKKDTPVQQTLRVVPEALWLEHAMKYVGSIRKNMTWGYGINAVKIQD